MSTETKINISIGDRVRIKGCYAGIDPDSAALRYRDFWMFAYGVVTKIEPYQRDRAFFYGESTARVTVLVDSEYLASAVPSKVILSDQMLEVVTTNS